MMFGEVEVRPVGSKGRHNCKRKIFYDAFNNNEDLLVGSLDSSTFRPFPRALYHQHRCLCAVGRGFFWSAIVMVRCNSEIDSDVSVDYETATGTASSITGDALDATDYTVSLMVEGLTSNTTYEYTATCSSVDASTTVQSTEAEFTTLPSEDVGKEISFVWAADLAGQGWGR